jgi:hypothetical protein
MPDSEFLPINQATDLTKVLSMPREIGNEGYFADTKLVNWIRCRVATLSS